MKICQRIFFCTSLLSRRAGRQRSVLGVAVPEPKTTVFFILLSIWMFFMFSVVYKGQEPRGWARAIWAALDNVSATELQSLSLIKVMFSGCLLSGFTVTAGIAYLQVQGATLPKDTGVSPSLRNLSLTPVACPGALSSSLRVCSLSGTPTIIAHSFLLRFWPRSSLIWLLPPALHWVRVLSSWLP